MCGGSGARGSLSLAKGATAFRVRSILVSAAVVQRISNACRIPEDERCPSGGHGTDSLPTGSLSSSRAECALLSPDITETTSRDNIMLIEYNHFQLTKYSCPSLTSHDLTFVRGCSTFFETFKVGQYQYLESLFRSERQDRRSGNSPWNNFKPGEVLRRPPLP